MSKRRTKMLKKTSLFIVLVFLLVFSGFVSADTLFLGPDSFQRYNSNTFVTRSSSELNADNSLGSYYLYAPILLPDGAKINSMVIFHYDNNSDSNISVKIIRENRYDNSQQTIIPTWSSTDSATDPKITKRTNVNYTYNKILTASCTYHVELRFVDPTTDPYDYSNLRFYGIKIFYTPPTS